MHQRCNLNVEIPVNDPCHICKKLPHRRKSPIAGTFVDGQTWVVNASPKRRRQQPGAHSGSSRSKVELHARDEPPAALVCSPRTRGCMRDPQARREPSPAQDSTGNARTMQEGPAGVKKKAAHSSGLNVHCCVVELEVVLTATPGRQCEISRALEASYRCPLTCRGHKIPPYDRHSSQVTISLHDIAGDKLHFHCL